MTTMTLTDANGTTITDGDRVETTDCPAEDADTGIFHGLANDCAEHSHYSDEWALVGWDSGVTTPVEFASIRRA